MPWLITSIGAPSPAPRLAPPDAWSVASRTVTEDGALTIAGPPGEDRGTIASAQAMERERTTFPRSPGHNEEEDT